MEICNYIPEHQVPKSDVKFRRIDSSGYEGYEIKLGDDNDINKDR